MMSERMLSLVNHLVIFVFYKYSNIQPMLTSVKDISFDQITTYKTHDEKYYFELRFLLKLFMTNLTKKPDSIRLSCLTIISFINDILLLRNQDGIMRETNIHHINFFQLNGFQHTLHFTGILLYCLNIKPSTQVSFSQFPSYPRPPNTKQSCRKTYFFTSDLTIEYAAMFPATVDDAAARWRQCRWRRCLFTSWHCLAACHTGQQSLSEPLMDKLPLLLGSRVCLYSGSLS